MRSSMNHLADTNTQIPIPHNGTYNAGYFTYPVEYPHQFFFLSMISISNRIEFLKQLPSKKDNLGHTARRPCQAQYLAVGKSGRFCNGQCSLHHSQGINLCSSYLPMSYISPRLGNSELEVHTDPD